MQRTSTNTAATTRTPTSIRDALGTLTTSDEDASRLYEAVRDSLRGRGKNRRDAEEMVTGYARSAGARMIPVLLAVRDELAREDPAPRGLAGRADTLLLAFAEAAQGEGGTVRKSGGLRAGDRGGPAWRPSRVPVVSASAPGFRRRGADRRSNYRRANGAG